jgi:hypothetical protein
MEGGLGDRGPEQAGVFAGLIGFIALSVLLIVWYRLPGLVAVIALMIYMAFMFAIFKLIPVTLTAAGIAGFIISLGLAVDGNILISERLKEEIRGGQPVMKLYEGTKGVRQIFEDVLESVTTSKDKQYWIYSSATVKERKLVYAAMPDFNKKRLSKKIKVQTISLGLGGELVGLDQRKWLNSKNANLKATHQIIYAGKVAHISLDDAQNPHGSVGKASEEGAVKKPTPQEISDAKARLASSLESFDRESASLLKEAIGLDAVGLCDRKAAIEAIAASIIADAQTCGMRSKAKDRNINSNTC